MSNFRIRNENALTEEEMLYLWENDDLDYETISEADVASDAESNDHVSDQKEVDDQIYASGDEESSKTERSAMDIPFYTAKDGTQWSKIPTSKHVRRSRANKILHAPGLTPKSSGISTIRDAFMLFFSEDILDIIVTETSRKAKNFFDVYKETHLDHTRKYVPTNRREIETYIGLLITLGALQGNTESVEMLFTSDSAYCRPIIPASLSRNRYQFLTKFLRFDNFETRAARKLVDKLAPIREVFDKLVSICKEALNPSTHMCVDEQLVPFRGKAPFRVYMKSKPAKYGIKIWALADCEYNYTINIQVYLGKEGNRPEKGQGERVVRDLTDHLGQGYGITTDNFLRVFSWLIHLWDKDLTLCGTLRKNKTFIPQELLPTSTRKKHSSIFAFWKTLYSGVLYSEKGQSCYFVIN